MNKLGPFQLSMLLVAFFVFGLIAEWNPFLVCLGAACIAVLVVDMYGER